MMRWMLCLLLSVGLLPLVSCASKTAKPDSQNSTDDFQDADSSGSVDEMEQKLDAESDAEPKKADDFSGSQSVSKTDVKKLSDALKSKNDKAVIREVSAILGRDPDNLDALNALAVYYFQNQKYGMAKIILNRAIKKYPKNASLHNNMGIIYLAEGDMREAIESFRASLSESTSYRFGGTNLSSIYLEHLDYQRALSPLEESYGKARFDLRRGDETAVEVANNYGVALMGLGQGSKAEEVFEAVANSGTRNPIPFLNQAILLVEVQKKKNDAIRAISKLKFMTEDREILRRVEELEQKMTQK